MNWILDEPLSWLQNFAINIIKSGPVPKHVAFIMDGNRRYAAKKNVQKAEGHSMGFHKLAETLKWCRKIGINEVTVYAFSIENFKRSQEEVNTLMELAREKFARLLEERDKLMEHGVRIRIFGKLSLLPADIRASIAKAMLMTKDNNNAFLNVAFAYTAREEITNAVQTVVKGVQDKSIDVEDIDEKLLSDCMYINNSPNPDIIVRTSGEIRFSDFLLWQISDTKIHFTKVLWPEFNIWHLLMAVFQYQRTYHTQQSVKFDQQNIRKECLSENNTEKKLTFLHKVNGDRLKELERYAIF